MVKDYNCKLVIKFYWYIYVKCEFNININDSVDLYVGRIDVNEVSRVDNASVGRDVGDEVGSSDGEWFEL